MGQDAVDGTAEHYRDNRYTPQRRRPGMDTEPEDATDQTLDVREVDGEPFGVISSALDRLDDGETLLLINGFEPEPLYGVLDRRGFAHEASRVDDGEWHVRIEPE